MQFYQSCIFSQTQRQRECPPGRNPTRTKADFDLMWTVSVRFTVRFRSSRLILRNRLQLYNVNTSLSLRIQRWHVQRFYRLADFLDIQPTVIYVGIERKKLTTHNEHKTWQYITDVDCSRRRWTRCCV